MNSFLNQLEGKGKLLFAIPLRPVQGHRFQPTGFPSLGAATYQTAQGLNLLVESAQSMANRLEAVCWDDNAHKPVADLDGISYIRVEREQKNGPRTYLTSSITEAHRINSPYMLEGSDKSFFAELKEALGGLESGPIDRKKLGETLLRYDASTLLHGVFLAKKELAGGRLRIARAMSAFIEAEGVRQAVSGGVKNDHVNPSGDTSSGFGNVPFSREEYTAEKLTLYVNIDLAQIRGYGFEPRAEKMLILLALYKLRSLLESSLRLRTACDLEVAASSIAATSPAGFLLPSLNDIQIELREAIAMARDLMKVTTVLYNDDLKKGKATDEGKGDSSVDSSTEEAQNDGV